MHFLLHIRKEQLVRPRISAGKWWEERNRLCLRRRKRRKSPTDIYRKLCRSESLPRLPAIRITFRWLEQRRSQYSSYDSSLCLERVGRWVHLLEPKRRMRPSGYKLGIPALEPAITTRYYIIVWPSPFRVRDENKRETERNSADYNRRINAVLSLKKNITTNKVKASYHITCCRIVG